MIGGDDIYFATCRQYLSHNLNAGEIFLILGPVKLGKTTEIIRLLRRYSISGRETLLIRHPYSWPDDHNPPFDVKSTKFLPMFDDIERYDVIGVDEAQRYEGIADWADGLANDGKIIIIGALDGNEYHKPFPGIIDLVPICEHIQKLCGVCPVTGLPAPFTVKGFDCFIPVSRFAIVSGISFEQYS